MKSGLKALDVDSSSGLDASSNHCRDEKRD